MTLFFQDLAEQETGFRRGCIADAVGIEERRASRWDRRSEATQPKQQGTDDEVIARCEDAIEREAGEPGRVHG
jgi:hypothetical protein